MKFGLNEETIKRLHTVFKKHPQIKQVIVYGSRAKGNFRNGSDIDLTLKGENLNLSLVSQLESEIDDLLLPYTFDISIFNQISNPDLIQHIEEVGAIFYSR